MKPVDWLAAAVVVGGLVFLRRCIVALGRRASAAARKRPPLGLILAITDKMTILPDCLKEGGEEPPDEEGGEGES